MGEERFSFHVLRFIVWPFAFCVLWFFALLSERVREL